MNYLTALARIIHLKELLCRFLPLKSKQKFEQNIENGDAHYVAKNSNIAVAIS